MLKKYAILYRSLEGINAAVVGIMLGASLYLIKDVSSNLVNTAPLVWVLSALTFLASTYLSYYKKLATHWIVLLVILIGFMSTYIA